MLQSFRNWWAQPFNSQGSVWNWFFFILLLLVVIIFWTRVLAWLSRVEVAAGILLAAGTTALLHSPLLHSPPVHLLAA